MIGFALDDDAFESNIKSARDIFRTRVLPPRHSLQFRWKNSILKSPIYRQAVPSINGVQTSSTKPLRYHTYLYYLQRLGITTGLMEILQPYDIRRGSGNKVTALAVEPNMANVSQISQT
jgi:Protein of unknown function (DUF3435)